MTVEAHPILDVGITQPPVMPAYRHLLLPSTSVVYGYLTLVRVSMWRLRHRVGYAWCAPTDQFSRARGRQIACGRAHKRPVYLELDDERPWAWAALLEMLATDEAMDLYRVPRWLDVEGAIETAEMAIAMRLREGNGRRR